MCASRYAHARGAQTVQLLLISVKTLLLLTQRVYLKLEEASIKPLSRTLQAGSLFFMSDIGRSEGFPEGKKNKNKIKISEYLIL